MMGSFYSTENLHYFSRRRMLNIKLGNKRNYAMLSGAEILFLLNILYAENVDVYR